MVSSPLIQEVRFLDKLVDELVKIRKMEKIYKGRKAILDLEMV
ncbi:DUF2200 family protein [Zobellia alginiliquefaciens]